MILNNSNLNLKETVETTFENAKGWLFAKYPSKQNSELNIQINVRYPEDFSTGITLDRKIDFSKIPTRLSIRRKQTSVLLYRDVFIDSDGTEKVSYSIQINNHGKAFRAIEIPTGEMFEQGDVTLLRCIQADEEFGQYISFISKTDKTLVPKHLKKWKLNDMMERSRS